MTDVVAEAIDDIEVRRWRKTIHRGVGDRQCLQYYLAFCLRGYPDNDVAPQLNRIFVRVTGLKTR